MASYRIKHPVQELFHATIPSMLVLLACALLIIYWPALSLVFVRSFTRQEVSYIRPGISGFSPTPDQGRVCLRYQ